MSTLGFLKGFITLSDPRKCDKKCGLMHLKCKLFLVHKFLSNLTFKQEMGKECHFSITYSSHLVHDPWVYKHDRHLSDAVKVELRIWHLRMLLEHKN